MRPIVLILAITFCADAQSFPDGPGKDTFQVICTSCHDPTKVLDKQWTKAQWKDKILEMLQEEKDVTEQEREQIADYLARNFGKKVNVNKAPAEDLAAALDLSAKDAGAIVAYRTSKGSFKSTEDVKKVPGLDAAKIEAAKQRLEF